MIVAAWVLIYVLVGIGLTWIGIRTETWSDDVLESPALLGLLVLIWPFWLIAFFVYGVVYMLGVLTRSLARAWREREN